MDIFYRVRQQLGLSSFDRSLTWTSNKSPTFLPGHDLVLFYLALWASRHLFLVIFSSLSSSVVPHFFSCFACSRYRSRTFVLELSQYKCYVHINVLIVYSGLCLFLLCQSWRWKALMLSAFIAKFLLVFSVALFTLVKASPALHPRLLGRPLPELESKLAMIKKYAASCTAAP